MSTAEKTFKFSPQVFKTLWRNTVRFNKIIWHERKWLLLVLAVLAITSAIEVFLSSGLQGLLINELIALAGGLTVSTKLFWLAGLLILSNLLPSFLGNLQNYFYKIFYFFTEYYFENKLLKQRAATDVANYENSKFNDLLVKINEKGLWSLTNFGDRQFDILEAVIGLVIASVIIIIAQWWLLPIIILCTLPRFWAEAKYGNRVWSIYASHGEVRRKYTAVRSQFFGLQGIKEIKLFQTTTDFLKKIKQYYFEFQNEQVKIEKHRLGWLIGASLLSQLGLALSLAWFIYQVIQGNLLIGTLTFLLASVTALRSSLNMFFTYLGQQYQDNLFITDIFSFLDIPPAIKTSPHATILDLKRTPEIIFENVSFKYPQTDKWILKNLSLKITAGQKLAIVGSNGSGKTTLIKLLFRFYDPTKGKILVDGRNLKTLDLESWYALIAGLFQDYANYQFLTKEAIGIGRSDKKLNLAKIREAATLSGANEFIEKWPEQYDKQLGRNFTNGADLSGGEWQKMALARTFYRDAHVLVLDEPTSSIDAEAEAKIFEKLEHLSADKTVIFISHRFSTVRQADQIVVVENGTINEHGTHAELLAQNGTYARLFNLQAIKYQ